MTKIAKEVISQVDETTLLLLDFTSFPKNTPSTTDISKVDVSHLTTKSAKIRYYDSLGFSRGQIAKEMDIIYQHVRNVLITPIKSK